MPNQTNDRVQLPEGLQTQFASLERRLWRVESAHFLLAGTSCVLLSILLLFASDRLWETPAWARVTLTVSSLAALGLAGFVWMDRWLIRRRAWKTLSLLVQRRFRRLGDRLLGIVELAQEENRPVDFSPGLYRAAIQQVAGDAAQYDFAEAVDTRPARRWSVFFTALLALAALLALTVPSAAGNVIARWVHPTAEIPRFTFVQFVQLPPKQIVAHGEPFDFECEVRYRSFWRPNHVRFQMDGQNTVSAGVEHSRVQVRLAGQVQNGMLKLALGDARGFVQVLPTHRPALRELAASISLPDYLQYEPRREILSSGAFKPLAGSRVDFEGQMNRTLHSASIQFPQGAERKLEVIGERFRSGPLGMDGVSQCLFQWKDNLGLSAAAPFRLQVQVQNDLPPQASLPDLPRDFAILESEVLEITALAEDDFGVRSLGLHWDLGPLSSTITNNLDERFQALSASPQETNMVQIFFFSPSLMNLPPDSAVELRAQAIDFFPGREWSHSPACRIHVLGMEQHAEMVRQHLESLLGRLEEVTRLEENLKLETGELKKDPNAAQAGERAGKAGEAQQANARKLDQLAKEGVATLREALRNPVFKEETLRQWTRALQQMQSLARGKMGQAARSLQAAQKPDARPEKLEEALQTEQEVLDALAQLQKQVNEHLDQLQALTLAQRLRKLGGEEKEIQSKIEQNVTQTIGLLPSELPDLYQKLNATLASTQTTAQEKARELRDEISRFFERTRRPNYGEVSKQMETNRTTDELDRLRGLIQENICMESIQQLGLWSKRFGEWADLLEPKSDSSAGGGGGSGSGGQTMDVTEQLMALLRLRERELTLREETHLLDDRKPPESEYQQSAKRLSSRHHEITTDYGRVRDKLLVLPPLVPPLNQTAEAMNSVNQMLQKPQTDQAAQAAQTQTVQLLTDLINLINEQARRSNNGQQSASQQEEMSFLMKMMSEQKSVRSGKPSQNSGGGNTAGGSTDRPAKPLPPGQTGKEGPERSVSHAGGSAAAAPVEFREALQNYYHAIEQEKQ